MNTKPNILFYLALGLLIALAVLFGFRLLSAGSVPAFADATPCSGVQGDPPIDDPEPTASGTVTFASSSAGVEDATVRLFGCVSGAGVLAATTSTDANGDYLFEGITPGRHYYVKVDVTGPLDGYKPTQGTENPSPAFGLGESVGNIDFAFE